MRLYRASLVTGLALGLCAEPTLAQTPMTAEEFDAYATGKTLDFANQGVVFGTEEYLPDRRVRWGPANGICKSGQWYAKGDQICFAYDGYPGEHCWTIWRDGDRLAALPSYALPNDSPRSVSEATAPLSCQGPDVGV